MQTLGQLKIIPSFKACFEASLETFDLNSDRLLGILFLFLVLSRSVVSNSLRPHGLQSASFLHSWDSPGKNTGLGCHFLLQCMKVKSESEVAQSCPNPRDPMECSLPGSSVHGIFQARVLEWVAIAFSQKKNLYECVNIMDIYLKN